MNPRYHPNGPQDWHPSNPTLNPPFAPLPPKKNTRKSSNNSSQIPYIHLFVSTRKDSVFGKFPKNSYYTLTVSSICEAIMMLIRNVIYKLFYFYRGGSRGRVQGVAPSPPEMKLSSSYIRTRFKNFFTSPSVTSFLRGAVLLRKKILHPPQFEVFKSF